MIKRSTSRVLASAALLAAIGFAGFSMRSTNAIAAEAQPSGGAAGTSTKFGAALQSHDLSLEQAQVVLAAAVKKAQELHINQDVAVVDAGGNLKAFYRMDNAWLGSIDISIKKAKTARYFDMPTGAIGKLSQPGGPLYQIEVSNGGLITFPGGVPIKAADDTIIGAVGVSGSTVENDEECAKAGAAAIR